MSPRAQSPQSSGLPLSIARTHASALVALCALLGLGACDSKKPQSAGTQAPQAGAGAAGEAPSNAAAQGASAKPQVGAVAPALNAQADLSALAGKVVLVDFWASWCAPCREELPELEALHKKYADKGLHIIGVNVDEERPAMDAFLESMPLSFQVVFDEGKAISERWDPPKMPTSYIIDKTGKIQLVQAGYEKGDLAAMETKIDQLLTQ